MISVLSGSSRALTCLHAPVFDIESSYLSEHTTKCVDMTLSLCAHPCNKAFGRASKFGEADLHDDQCSQSLKNENWHPPPILKHACDMDETRSSPMDFLKNERLLGNLGGWRFHIQAALGAQARGRKWSGVEELLEAIWQLGKKMSCQKSVKIRSVEGTNDSTKQENIMKCAIFHFEYKMFSPGWSCWGTVYMGWRINIWEEGGR